VSKSYATAAPDYRSGKWHRSMESPEPACAGWWRNRALKLISQTRQLEALLVEGRILGKCPVNQCPQVAASWAMYTVRMLVIHFGYVFLYWPESHTAETPSVGIGCCRSRSSCRFGPLLAPHSVATIASQRTPPAIVTQQDMFVAERRATAWKNVDSSGYKTNKTWFRRFWWLTARSIYRGIGFRISVGRDLFL